MGWRKELEGRKHTVGKCWEGRELGSSSLISAGTRAPKTPGLVPGGWPRRGEDHHAEMERTRDLLCKAVTGDEL